MPNYTLYHFSLCPFSRKIRFILNSLNMAYKMREVRFWNRPRELVKLNQASETPVLVDTEIDAVLIDSFVIAEYLDAVNFRDDLLKFSFLFGNEIQKAEIRRLEMWFDKKFYNEVSKYILEEKVYNYLSEEKTPINTARLKCGQNNLNSHLKYIEHLLSERKWLAGESFSLADIAAAVQLSSLDYLGEVPWKKCKTVKDWYITIKSKIAFQPILKDKIEGFVPFRNYAELDFD